MPDLINVIPAEDDSPVALFFFAHQDDEFGVFAQIEHELRSGRRVCCVYVTDGAATAVPHVRDAESKKVLQMLGVSADNIMFIGQSLQIRDGQLHLSVDAFADWLEDFMYEYPMIERCFVPAWEGGHPDHDLIHAIVIIVFTNQSKETSIWQYSLYNGLDCYGPFFRTLSPIPENGLVIQSPIDWRNRLRYLQLCLSYPSQWRTWIGLFPFVCAHYIWCGVQELQYVKYARIFQLPHVQPLYYERRGFLDWPTLLSTVKQIVVRTSVRLNNDDNPDY